jgi:hypothetical protein
LEIRQKERKIETEKKRYVNRFYCVEGVDQCYQGMEGKEEEFKQIESE